MQTKIISLALLKFENRVTEQDEKGYHVIIQATYSHSRIPAARLPVSSDKAAANRMY